MLPQQLCDYAAPLSSLPEARQDYSQDYNRLWVRVDGARLSDAADADPDRSTVLVRV